MIKPEKYLIGLTSDELFLFKKLVNLYGYWNSKINISSIKNDKQVVIKHFYDSLLWNEMMDFSWKKVIDIWTWWWYAVLPLAITNTDAQFVAFDSVSKKLKVIQETSKDLWLVNVSILHWRAEDLARDKSHREMYDIVCERAFAPFSPMLEMCSGFVKVWWYLLAYQTSSFVKEMDANKGLLSKFWLEFIRFKKFILPEDMWDRVLVLFKKVKSLDDKYPRAVWVPRKKPV